MNAGLCVRRGCQWPDDLVSERRGCVNARARAAGGGPQLCEPPHDARVLERAIAERGAPKSTRCDNRMSVRLS
jgi:hypothetical protein